MVDPEDADRPGAGPGGNEIGDDFARTRASAPMFDRDKRRAWGLGAGDDDVGPYLVELNVRHRDGLPGAREALRLRFIEIGGDAEGEMRDVSQTYVQCMMSWHRCLALLAADEGVGSGVDGSRARPAGERAIHRLWPDFPVRSQIYRSLPTIKANAAAISFEADGEGIVWAVIDSGIDASHVHFARYGNVASDEVQGLHRSFVGEENAADALHDGFGHGTHVAGIIAGAAPDEDEARVAVYERVQRPRPGTPDSMERTSERVDGFEEQRRLHGVAPRARLVSLKVLDDQGQGRSSDVIRALEYLREQVNDNPKLLRVHGVNLSVGYEFDAELFACGQSPICAEVDRLVRSGVVVVTAAGNTGYGVAAAQERTTKVGLSNTINDPGNAELAITVGATHRDAPYRYGVSYFSSKGPTGDGRVKPDLVAPGERITSCAAGSRKTRAVGEEAQGVAFNAVYVEDSGTSMAAPHVSGAIAAFLSIRAEFIARPDEVKRIFTATATSLGREKYFEGHGLVDLIRAIQSV